MRPDALDARFAAIRRRTEEGVRAADRFFLRLLIAMALVFGGGMLAIALLLERTP